MDRTLLFTSYIGRDHWRNRAFVQVETEVTAREWPDVEHAILPAGQMSVHITGWTVQYKGRRQVSGGQISRLLHGMSEYAPGWTEADVKSLRRIWNRWHLNNMRAACAHMDEDEAKDAWHGHNGGPYQVVCPETGYKYGSAWLFEPVPDEVWSELSRLAKLPHGHIARGI